MAEKVVLCYGDSNTWGDVPTGGVGRFSRNERWPGLLAKNLGEKYYVVEEGLCGRTTDIDTPEKSTRNGAIFLPVAIETHRPDIVILMLGTNDLKKVFHRNASDVASALAKMIDQIREFSREKPVEILLVSPILIDDSQPGWAEIAEKMNDGAVEQSHEFASKFAKVASDKKVAFLDAAKVASPGADGVHLTSEGHRLLAEAFAAEIPNLGEK